MQILADSAIFDSFITFWGKEDIAKNVKLDEKGDDPSAWAMPKGSGMVLIFLLIWYKASKTEISFTGRIS